MTTVVPESVTNAVSPAAPPPVSHPTPCPAWCRDRHDRTGHEFGPTSSWHWSPEHVLLAPPSGSVAPAPLVRAELTRVDEDSATADVKLYVQAEQHVVLSPAEADIFIANMQAFVDTLWVLRGQMGAG